MTRREALGLAEEQLKKAGIEDAALDAKYLLTDLTGISLSDLFLGGEEPLSEEQYENYQEAVKRRASHEPLQYITGVQEFMGFNFHVSPAVLIPRQDTECLVETVLPHAAGKRVLDMCTGSGCIIISIAKLRDLTCAAGCDISDEALEIAKKNAQMQETSIAFLQSDLFSDITEKYDIIVSNPPYICTGDIDWLMPEVRDHEPHLALDGDWDGLRFYREIAENAGEHLNPGGMLFFEIGCEQAEAVVYIMDQCGFKRITVRKDYAGHDRIVYGRWNG